VLSNHERVKGWLPFFIARFLPMRSCSRRHTAISLGSTCVKSRISCVPPNRRRAVCLDADSAMQLVFICRGADAKWVTELRRPEVTFVVAMRSGQRAVQIYADGQQLRNITCVNDVIAARVSDHQTGDSLVRAFLRSLSLISTRLISSSSVTAKLN
jgi:hypothetical protein